MEYKTVKTDVLVIGGGGAGLMAALEAKGAGAEVTLVIKGAGSSPGIGGFNVALGEDDSPDLHFKDTISGGLHVNNPRLVRILVDEAKDALATIAGMGLSFEMEKDQYALLQPLGCSVPRCVCFSYDPPPPMTRLRQVAEDRGVQVMRQFMVTSLLQEEERVVGACGFHMASGELVAFEARGVVLATGGAGQLFSFSDNTPDVTGDGHSMAYTVGAEFVDMEFMQFEPLKLLHPRNPMIGIVTTIFATGGELRNSEDERFMSRYDPERGERTQKDIMSRAIAMEVRAGRGTPHGGAYFDVSRLPNVNEIIEGTPWYSVINQEVAAYGIDLRKDAIEVGPAAHTYIGGVRIDEKCATTIPGLYAAGEVTGGLHGANRLGGNAGIETLVFGRRAGASAAEYATTQPRPHVHHQTISKALEKLKLDTPAKEETQHPVTPTSIKSEIQVIMDTHAGILRNEAGLQAGLTELQTIQTKQLPRLVATTVQGLQDAVEARNMLITGELLIRAALSRHESRGAHYREDHPTMNPKWRKTIILRQSEGLIEMWTRPLETL